MRFSLVFLALLSCLLGSVVNVDAHARLVSPMAWNPQPSTRQVCGVAAAGAIPARYVVSQVNAANPLVVQWEIVAADGRGPLTARLDTTAKTNPTMADFTVTLPTTPGTQNNPTRVSATPYRISFQIPAGTVCTGTGGTCTLRVASSSNWVACATIRLMGAGGAAAATTTPTIAPPATTAPAIQPSMPVPTAQAPLFPTPKGSGGTGGLMGAYRIPAAASKSGLEYLIAANPPQVAGRPQGVIMFLHGSTASNYMNGLRMFAQVAQQNDFIRVSVLAPNGQGWNEGGFNAQVTAANMLANLVTQDLLPAYNIDMAKVFFTGQSSGAGFLSQFFVPLQAKNMPGGGAFFQCGAAAPAVQFQPTAALIQNFKLHFEITTGDQIWPASYARAIAAYTAAGMSFTMLNTKPGGHCAFDQQQVVIDRLPAMLPKAINTPAAGFATQDASGNEFVVFSASATTTTRCVVAQGLKSCPKVNGQSVQLLTTSDLMMVDTAAENAITFGLSNTDVITTTPSVACQQAYRDLICAAHFIPCGETIATTCQASCRTANQVCSFNQTMIEGDVAHASLYDCTKDTYQQAYADANGVCADAPPALPASTGQTGVNSAMSYAQPMLLITFISLIAKLFH